MVSVLSSRRGDATPTLQRVARQATLAEQHDRLVAFLFALALTALLFGGAILAVGAHLASWRVGGAGAVVLGVAATALTARARARERGDLSGAASMAAGAILGHSLLNAALMPFAATPLAVANVLALAVALPYVVGPALGRIVAATIAVSIAVPVAGFVIPGPTSLPAWLKVALVVGASAAATSLAGVLLAEFARRLRDALGREARARGAAERAAVRSARLQTIASALSRSLTTRGVAEVVIEHARDVLRASAGAIYFDDAEGGRHRLAAKRGDAARALDATEVLSSVAAGPLAAAIRDRAPRWLGDRAAVVAASNDGARPPPSDVQAIVALPLEGEERVIGGLILAFGEPQPFDDADRDFLLSLTGLCAQACARARLYEEQVQSRRQVEQLADDLRRAVSARDDFLSIAGHELKTPLAALQLHLQGLVRLSERAALGDDPSRIVDRMHKAVRSGTRLERLINELLDVSRLASGKLTHEPEPLDLVVLLGEVVERFTDDRERTTSTVSVRAPARLVGEWDRTRLDQVLTNLLSNALKYGAGRPVEVTLEAAGGRARLAVRDHGIGISSADQERIFGRFERAVSERAYGGLGLGLWITRQIVEDMGGSIGFTSTPADGTVFTVELPLAPMIAAS